jgi:hypothetical protein
MVCIIAMVSIHPYKNLLCRETIKKCVPNSQMEFGTQ